MSDNKTVKAREHYGADSLDLTIPSEIVRKHGIESGDIFEIEITEKEGETVLKYQRVYKSE